MRGPPRTRSGDPLLKSLMIGSSPPPSLHITVPHTPSLPPSLPASLPPSLPLSFRLGPKERISFFRPSHRSSRLNSCTSVFSRYFLHTSNEKVLIFIFV